MILDTDSAIAFLPFYSGFIHGFRYLVRALHRIVSLDHHHTMWPRKVLKSTSAHEIALAMNKRFQTSSGLYQMFGVLADVVIVMNNQAIYMEEV